MAIKQKEKKIKHVTTTKQVKQETKHDMSALFIPAGLLLGIGCGFIFVNIIAGLFIGLGAGMVAYAILRFIR